MGPGAANWIESIGAGPLGIAGAARGTLLWLPHLVHNMALRSLLFLACVTPVVAGCKDCNIARNGMWDVKCGAFYEESSKIADWTLTFFRRRLEAGVEAGVEAGEMAQLEAGDKADFKKFLTAMQRKGRVEAVDQTEAADETGRRLSTCDDTCFWDNDGECDDGQDGGIAYCTCGTDCSDCGSRASCDTATDDYYTNAFSTGSDFLCIKDVCCAEDKDDCCELNVGAVVGTAIALLVVLVGSILACCKFCPGCPMNNAGKETEMTKV